MKKWLRNIDKLKPIFRRLYGPDKTVLNIQQERYMDLLDQFCQKFEGYHSVHLFSTPGRTEIGGNHTDHNNGRVLAASINLDTIAVAGKRTDKKVTLYSAGFEKPFQVDLSHLSPISEEERTSSALIRGIAAQFQKRGYDIGGFDAYLTSNVMIGSGLSSSASVEVLIGSILNHLFNHANIDPEILAISGQYAENFYFGKPCGLMDQIACAVGGIVTIDFANPQNPFIKKVDFDFAVKDYRIVVVDSGGSHADLTDDYAAVPKEMKAVASFFDREVCRDIKMADVLTHISELRRVVNDRAILRALHFLEENERVAEQVSALENNNFDTFLDLVNDSGNSSFKWLQNGFSARFPNQQGISLALALTERFLKGRKKGACRVHGGGFAGTIQVFMPVEYLDEYRKYMESVFGADSVLILTVRPYGTFKLRELELGVKGSI
jgi:galactokinase